MQQDTVLYIHSMADKISKFCSLHVPPSLNDMLVCLNKLHGRLEEVATLDVTFDGIVTKNDDDGFTIRLPRLMTDEDKVFYLAKGIGHAFMHLNYPGPGNNNCTWLLMEPDFYFSLNNNAHAQAFEFAHYFLKDGKHIM